MDPTLQSIEKTIVELKPGRKYIFFVPVEPKTNYLERLRFIQEIKTAFPLTGFDIWFILLTTIKNIKVIEFNQNPGGEK